MPREHLSLRKSDKRQPLVILIAPPVYDFALFDLFIKPYPLLKLGRAFASSGYRVELINCLDYRNELSGQRLGKPKRKSNGTGKFFRQHVEKPAVLTGVPRSYSRYGIVRDAVLDRLKQRDLSRPSLLLLTTGMTYWYPGVREIVEILHSLYPGVPVVAGGIYASLCGDHCLSTIGPDYLVKGNALPGLNKIISSLSLPAISAPSDGDLLLLPGLLSDAAVVRLNTGCPFRCGYCASHALSGGFSPGSASSVFRLIERMHDRLGVRNFAFYDDALLTAKETAFIPLLQMLIESGMDLNLYLPNAVHLAGLDPECALLMRRAGFREVRIGFESSDPQFHRVMDEKLKVPMLSEGIEILRNAGFSGHEIYVYVLAGLPGQHWEEVEESIRFAASFGIRVSLAEYSPVPGTRLWAESVRCSRYPLEEEPLTHNNSILPLEWNGFTVFDMQRLFLTSRSLSPPR